VAKLMVRGIARWHYDGSELARWSYGGVVAARCSASAMLVREGEPEWERSGVTSRGTTLLFVCWLNRPGHHRCTASTWHAWPDMVGHDVASVFPI
jgi:hypothetical protein